MHCSASKRPPNPHTEALEAFLQSANKEMARKGMTSYRQWERYRSAHPDGYSLTRFRVALRRHERMSDSSMRMEHKAGINYSSTIPD